MRCLGALRINGRDFYRVTEIGRLSVRAHVAGLSSCHVGESLMPPVAYAATGGAISFISNGRGARVELLVLFTVPLTHSPMELSNIVRQEIVSYITQE